MKISIFRDGYANLNSTETIDDWSEFVDLVSTPVVGTKNGDYFIRGYCSGPRCDDNIVSLDLIIIDGDQLLDNGGSCCPIQPVHDIVKEEGITHVIYNSYSNDIMNGKHKWRLCIPCDGLVDADALSVGVAEIISLLHRHGAMVRNVHENCVLSQPWFTPRCPEATLEDFTALWHDGETYRIGTYEIVTSSGLGATSGGAKGVSENGTHFSWDYVVSEFSRGTIHMGLKAACGWLVRTTDWVDSQIKSHLIALVRALCPDKVKVARAEKGEIDNLIKYCRQKSGIYVDTPTADWKTRTITARDLRDKTFPEITWAVDGLIPEGLCVFAGDPKVGKSLIAVDICSSIASGRKAFGNRECVEGGAVYCSLEDPERRVKNRILTQCDLWPDRFRLVTGGIPTVGPEFFKILDEMTMLWPDLRCIIVDTLQYIVPDKPSGKSDYEHYYKFMGPLHDWAISNHIALVTITHTNKGQTIGGENPFNKIMGSQAISGCADSMLMLVKNHAKSENGDPSVPDGFLYTQGRELNAEKVPLEFDKEELRWTITCAPKIENIGNTRWIEIMDIMRRFGAVAPADITRATGYNSATIRSCLKRMKDKGFITVEDGKYSVCGCSIKQNTDW